MAGGVAFFLLKGGDDSPDDGINPTDHAIASFPPEANPVHFSLSGTTTVATVTKSKADQAQVNRAAKDIRDTLANMYTVAYTDPNHWESGDYDAVFTFFQEGTAADSAERDVATLTLGANAGDTYDEVKQRHTGLRVKILTDKGGAPFTAAATADFSADAQTKDGSNMLIKSHATYYLQHGEGGWVIVAYKANRRDGGSGGKGGSGSTTPATSSATSGASQ